jgi:transmembrane sensor
MEDKKLKIQQLYTKLTDKAASSQEVEELFSLLEGEDPGVVLGESFKSLWLKEEPEDSAIRERHQKILSSIIKNYPASAPVVRITHRVHFLKTAWFRYASIILIVLLSSVYIYLNSIKNKTHLISSLSQKDVHAPHSNLSTLTLANGNKVFLDSTGTGVLAIEGGTAIKKTNDGQLLYDKRIGYDLQYNLLQVPKGSQMAGIVLSDGSRVYLNSASSLKYPVAFNNAERKVEVTGEAYFEIAKDAKRKFIVVSKGVQTEVLGTEFNINAYADDFKTKVTLIEGKVKVSALNTSSIIKPGEQSEVGNDGHLQVIKDINLSQVTAWKKGLFMFNNTDLKTILNQVARWYNVEIDYRQIVEPRTFGGGINRQSPLSQVVKIFESNGVPCRIEENTLIIGK